MAVQVKPGPLNEEEKYLVALILDDAGIDMAEFMWEDPLASNDEQIFRAWDFQVSWFRDQSQKVINQCARAVGKTLSIVLRGWHFPIRHPGKEMVVTAPELVHLTPLVDLIERRLKEQRITVELLPKKVGQGFQHRPFHVSFLNGSRIMGRIPQKDGKGVKGLHPLRLEMDEAQDYPAPGWTELIETLTAGEEESQWRAHGVSRGVRDEFYRHSQIGSGWNVHTLTGMNRPTWSDEERESKIQLYGSRDSPDYKRNILGQHGDATNPLFVLHRLMATVDTDLASEYNDLIYYNRRINDEMLTEQGIADLLDFPGSHKEWKVVYAGMDIGMTNHPSEILVFGEETQRKHDPALRLLSRIHLERIRSKDQRIAIEAVINFYQARRFTLDRTGLGLPIYQELQDGAPNLFKRIAAYAFDEKLVVGWDEYEEWEDPEDYEIKVRAKQFGYDTLRTYVDSRRLILPMDRELLGEWQGQTWARDTSGTSPYGNKNYAKGEFHTLDAAAMMVVGKEMLTLESMKEVREEPEEVPVIFV